MPERDRKFRKALNSPPLSEKRVPILVLNLFSVRALNRIKVSLTWDLSLRG